MLKVYTIMICLGTLGFITKRNKEYSLLELLVYEKYIKIDRLIYHISIILMLIGMIGAIIVC